MRPALTRSATRAVVEGVTIATPRPKRPDTSASAQIEVNVGTAGRVAAHRKSPATIRGLRPRRSERRPENGFATIVAASWPPITSAI